MSEKKVISLDDEEDNSTLTLITTDNKKLPLDKKTALISLVIRHAISTEKDITQVDALVPYEDLEVLARHWRILTKYPELQNKPVEPFSSERKTLNAVITNHDEYSWIQDFLSYPPERQARIVHAEMKMTSVANYHLLGDDRDLGKELKELNHGNSSTAAAVSSSSSEKGGEEKETKEKTVFNLRTLNVLLMGLASVLRSNDVASITRMIAPSAPLALSGSTQFTERNLPKTRVAAATAADGNDDDIHKPKIKDTKTSQKKKKKQNSPGKKKSSSSTPLRKKMKKQTVTTKSSRNNIRSIVDDDDVTINKDDDDDDVLIVHKDESDAGNKSDGQPQQQDSDYERDDVSHNQPDKDQNNGDDEFRTMSDNENNSDYDKRSMKKRKSSPITTLIRRKYKEEEEEEEHNDDDIL